MDRKLFVHDPWLDCTCSLCDRVYGRQNEDTRIWNRLKRLALGFTYDCPFCRGAERHGRPDKIVEPGKYRCHQCHGRNCADVDPVGVIRPARIVWIDHTVDRCFSRVRQLKTFTDIRYRNTGVRQSVYIRQRLSDEILWVCAIEFVSIAQISNRPFFAPEYYDHMLFAPGTIQKQRSRLIRWQDEPVVRRSIERQFRD